MKYLVTGGCGFIGSHIVDELVENGNSVIVIDNLSSEGNENFHFNPSQNVSYHNFDIRDFEKILPLFSGIDCVFHLAAESKIQPIINNPKLAVDVNVMGTCNVLEASRISDVKRVIYSSTSAIYGLKNEIPLNESMKDDCLNSYSVSKKSGEDLCKLYYKTWGLETVIFRYFNVYGDRHSTKGQYAPVIGKFLRQYKEGLPLTVVGDGTQKRDFIFVKDVVRANILASQSNNKEILGEIFNVGYGKNYSIIDLAKMIGGDIEFIDQRHGECLETLADISKIKSLLGWNPEVSVESWIMSQMNSGKFNRKIQITDFQIPPGHEDISNSFYKEIWIENEYDRYGISINEDDVVLDCGANIGLFTGYAISKGASKVCGFESDENIFEYYLKNFTQSNVKAFNHKIGHSDGCMNLDNILQLCQVDHFDFAKIDIEGHEYDLILNASDSTIGKINKWSIEFHLWGYHKNEATEFKMLCDIIEKFNNNGFNTYLCQVHKGWNLIMLYAKKIS